MASITSSLCYSLLQTGKYSDFTINCSNGDCHSVHKIILAAGSKYFQHMLRPGSKETMLGFVNLDDHDPDIIYQMLNFVYTGSYNEPHGTNTRSNDRAWTKQMIMELDELQVFETMKSSIRLHQAANFFGVDGLSAIVIGRMNLLIEHGDLNDGHFLAEALELLYQTSAKTDTALKAWITQRILISPKLRKYKTFEAIRKVIEEHEPVAYALCLSMRKELLKQESDINILEYKVDAKKSEIKALKSKLTDKQCKDGEEENDEEGTQ